jgi:3D (Asp-Asp-Asp) domain-containing protein
VFAAAYAAAMVVTVLTAIVAKEATSGTRAFTPLAAITPTAAISPAAPGTAHAARTGVDIAPLPLLPAAINAEAPATPDEIRWFDARPIRPARTIIMTVTAYSPDERSCGEFADGQTATLHSVWTNAMRLVAADPTVLPYGTMLTVPGYADDSVVPVLDCGGAIKGTRLDVLFPTHEAALKWGVRRIPVVVWEYADGLPAPNVRKVR